ncbi:MAG: iron-sulfur cluster assembly accessory protein [Holosporaceae bacterium]|jgi:iron-sulfur cluster assembly protein|nr:iron-sulfur cluster assembly accessory protein [Holosporaceae bacterium]
MKNSVDFTASAMNFLKKTVTEKSCLGVRFDIANGGCHGITYVVDPVEAVDESDFSWEQDGLCVYVTARAAIFVSGMTVDYVENGLTGHLVFQNPNARQSCNCGRSFSADESPDVCVEKCCG